MNLEGKKASTRWNPRDKLETMTTTGNPWRLPICLSCCLQRGWCRRSTERADTLGHRSVHELGLRLEESEGRDIMGAEERGLDDPSQQTGGTARTYRSFQGAGSLAPNSEHNDCSISLSPSCTNFCMVNPNSNHNRKAILGIIFPGLLSWSIPNSTLPSESDVMKFSTSGLEYQTHGPRWLSSKESGCQYKRRRFDPLVGKIPWRRTGNPLWYSSLGSLTHRRVWWVWSPWDLKRVEHDWVTRQQPDTWAGGWMKWTRKAGKWLVTL